MNKLFKTCEKCGESKSLSEFLPTRNILFPDGRTSICITCVEDLIEDNNGELNFMDGLCRTLDIAFEPERWLEYYKANGAAALLTFIETSLAKTYPMVDWKSLNEEYVELQKKGELRTAFQFFSDEDLMKLREKWGEQYDEKEIYYLEDLYQGILQTQNINSKLQTDDAKKLCKIELLLEQKIRGGEDFDKLIKSIDTLRKSAGFTEKNIKNAFDFESVGELFVFLERQGWLNEFYDDTPKDQVDLVMKDVQTWIRNLYKNESGIGEDVDRRIEALKAADELEESILGVPDDQDLDDFDTEGYDDFDEEAGI